MSQRRVPLPKEPASTLYVVFSATIAAAVLGLAIFLFVRGVQWQRALADLRAEPGIEILSVERAGFFKKRLRGLRDPLAPAAEPILRRHQIGPHAVDLLLAEYHSLNTPYALQREAEIEARTEGLRDSLVAAVADFTGRILEQRQADLEAFTRLVLETRFPEAMESVSLEWQEGDCFPTGELYAPLYLPFVAGAPQCLAEGEMRFERLVNLTESRTSSLRAEIESSDLLTQDLDGRFVHLERALRLLDDYDAVCERSEIGLPRVFLEFSVPSGGRLAEERAGVGAGVEGDTASVASVERLKRELSLRPGPGPERWLPERWIAASEGGASTTAHLKLVPAAAP